MLTQQITKSFFLTFFISILFCFFSTKTIAQFPKSQALEASILAGRILPHTEETGFQVNENSFGLQLNYQWQTHGQKDWHELQNYPLFGLSLIYFDLGEKEIFGNAYGIVPNLTINFLKRKKWNGFFNIGSGLAWLPTYYDPVSNPTNNAIGSRLNNATLFKWGLNYHLSNQFIFNLGGGLMHFSNGGAQLPNFGINIPVLALGCRFFPNPIEKDNYTRHQTDKKSVEKWKLSLAYTMAFREDYIIGGPRYPVYIASLAGNYFLNRKNKLSLGLEYEYHPSDYLFALHTFNVLTEKEAKKGARRLAVSLANEFLFGNWTIHLLTGYYVGNFSLKKPFPFYFKLSNRYYFPAISKPKTRFFAGVSLKSHLFRAEYIALGAGVEF